MFIGIFYNAVIGITLLTLTNPLCALLYLEAKWVKIVVGLFAIEVRAMRLALLFMMALKLPL